MPDLIVYGFPRSTFVNIVRLVLTHKQVAYRFHDLESEMGKPTHLALHPFNRVPILRHGDFTVYETSAIVAYLEEIFPKPGLQPNSARDRARMHQWISAVNSYYYPYMIYHVSHERNVFPELGIASDEKVVAHAIPKVEVALTVTERELAHGKDYLLGPELSLAGGQGAVCKIPRLLPMARTHGRFAHRKELARCAAAAGAHRARQRMGRLTSAEILGRHCSPGLDSKVPRGSGRNEPSYVEPV